MDIEELARKRTDNKLARLPSFSRRSHAACNPREDPGETRGPAGSRGSGRADTPNRRQFNAHHQTRGRANPKLKVMLIRDGSLLDESSLETLCAMATEADHQLWLERVGQDEHTTVVIEDGTVKE